MTRSTDDTIREIVAEIAAMAKNEGLTADWQGNYFSSNQLDDIRKVLEKSGFETAKIFIIGKMKRKRNQMELKQTRIILTLLDKLELAASLDLQTKSYIVGKLNQILATYKKEGGKI